MRADAGAVAGFMPGGRFPVVAAFILGPAWAGPWAIRLRLLHPGYALDQ